MESFAQGYRLLQTDLNIEFWRHNIHYPPPFAFRYSPYWIRYQIGVVPDDIQRFYRIGRRYRLPDELDTGLFRPNFIVGDTWGPGSYQIRWLYKVYENSDVQEEFVGFQVVSAGVFDGEMTEMNQKNFIATFGLVD